MLGNGNTGACLLAEPAACGNFVLGVCVEGIDTYNRIDTGLLDCLDVMEEVCSSCLNPAHVLLAVLFRHGTAGAGNGSAAVTLEGADGCDNNRTVGLETAETALEVPELLESDVCTKTTLSYQVVTKLQADLVGNNRGLTDGDICKRSCMNQTGLALYCLHEVGIYRLNHPRGHCACHLKVLCGNGLSGLVVSNNDLADALSQVLEVVGNCKYCHDL